HSFKCCRERGGTRSNSDIQAGTHNVALCISDHKDAPSPWETTASHVYVRGHGPGGAYQGNYHGRTLARWAAAIDEWSRDRREVFVYFDNDQKAAAPKDAQRLIRLVAGSRPRQLFFRRPRRCHFGMLLREPLRRHHVRCGGLQFVLPAADHTAFASHHRLESIFRNFGRVILLGGTHL